ncbi:hypothetical protein Dsin_007862 [Dipteronia sinensis]|uniref:Trichome birefringence-like N-terminal domain-containing protein n=1 Tax=Dipteronia sinensis TaxID=43782 RepID=A0AAE0B2A9_9ROSI|nr:hypothetical protein Dsin_007862 [Dipteronia sinensis]
MKLNWSLKKNNHLLVKLAVSILLVGLAFRLFVFKSQEFTAPSELETSGSAGVDRIEVVAEPEPETKAKAEGEAKAPEAEVSTVDVSEYEDQNQMPQNETEDQIEMPVKEKCDLFTGDWVPNPSGPVYTNASCPLIESHQNCIRNGRPDSGYLYWRWKPRDCELPPFDANKFLDMMRNKTWALVGDSISRNHVQSVLCMLSTVEQAVEVYHDEDYKSKRWHFHSYNFSVSVIWSPFLTEAATFEDFNGVSTSEVELQLDKLDEKWTDLYSNLDYMIISTGKWFLKSSIYYENDTVVGCHYCPKRNLTELGFDYAYGKTLHSVLDFIATSKHKGSIFFRTSTPDHFENGDWHNGTCERTNPAKGDEVELKYLSKILRDIELAEFEKAAPKAAENGVNLKLLDFTSLSLLRPDGHPGPYREFQPFATDKNARVQKDCLHWCLPGPIDAWNDLIMEMIINR